MKNICGILLISLCFPAFGQILSAPDTIHVDVGLSTLFLVGHRGDSPKFFEDVIFQNFSPDWAMPYSISRTIERGSTAQFLLVHFGTSSEIGYVELWASSGLQKTIVLVAGDPFGPPFTIDLGPDKQFCPGSSVELIAPPGHKRYQWSTGETTQNISVNSPGKYTVTVTNMAGVPASDFVMVQMLPTVEPVISVSTTFCPAFFHVLDAGAYASYLWSTGETSRSIEANTDGMYSVTVTAQNGCASHVEMLVTIPIEVPCGAQVSPITVDAVCSDNPSSSRRWKLTNPNNINVRVDWIIEGTTQKSWLDVPQGDSYLTTKNISNKSHMLAINWHDGEGALQYASAITTATKCANTQTSTSRVATATNIYPNPGLDQITIAVTHSIEDIGTIQIFSLSGELKRTQLIQMSAGTNFIMQDIGDLEKGVYIMKLNGESIRFTKE